MYNIKVFPDGFEIVKVSNRRTIVDFYHFLGSKHRNKRVDEFKWYIICMESLNKLNAI